ncbi:hypothetical protein GcM3_133031 [Golovinomyces cichoracearum]|uniref:Uncharacterized protein n=1 Tax=Golovinomyces cichoracearum TaxID=62708 RepID=A0A420I3L9_9PEZI|nr:hypothetical protein GcM3_133031 [Golovinomyces cichoracearum]
MAIVDVGQAEIVIKKIQQCKILELYMWHKVPDLVRDFNKSLDILGSYSTLEKKPGRNFLYRQWVVWFTMAKAYQEKSSS